MATTVAPVPFTLQRLWRRELTHYPDSARRYAYLGIVVVTTVVLYYALYIQYAVATSIITNYHMTYTYFVWISVVGNAVGAFASLAAGLADRWGRANMVVYGLLATGLLVTFGLPNASGKGVYMLMFALVGFVEGVVLVATPALIRDFSPQLGRATAMGYWTMGPVIGSLVVTEVTSHTLGATPAADAWQTELHYAGWATLLVFVLALFGLRELAPQLRDQIMVSLRDRALVEARAKGLDPDTAQRGHWRQMMKLDVVGSAVAISLFLLLYYAAVGNFVVYFGTAFGYGEQRVNALANWYWISNALALVIAGLVSDRLRVRKPFMVVGGVGSIVVTVLFALRATQPTTGYYTFAWLFVGIGVLTGITYAPWMASFTETVERHNPAATATGLAVWGWIIRVVVAVSAAFLPVVVGSVTTLVEDGPAVQAASVRAAPALAIVNQHPQLFAQLAQYKSQADIPPALLGQAVQQVGLPGLKTVQAEQADIMLLQQKGAKVQAAAKSNPHDWQVWWWVCVGGQVLFLPFVLVMAGRWSPKKAREDAEEHQRAVDAELAALSGEVA